MRRERWLARRVSDWFVAHARPLPWRPTRPGERDPYRSVVSEFMLQQTQVSRVLERFEPFIARFPTIDALAAADESDVLAAWSGLGYYRRARLLHALARDVRDRHGSQIPSEPSALRELPGVGRYTAGAIASIVFARREPLVDGNVLRVLQRIEGHAGPPDAPWAWAQAERLVAHADDPAVFNEGLMELGATVCIPASPRCQACPVAKLCRAHAQARQASIPEPKPRAERRRLYATSIVAIDRRSRVLLEQRPGTGLWASMWQCPTLERDDRHPEPHEIDAFIPTRSSRPVARFTFLTTHREVRFQVHRASGARARTGRVWVRPQDLAALGVSNAQRRVLVESGVLPRHAVSSSP